MEQDKDVKVEGIGDLIFEFLNFTFNPEKNDRKKI